MLTRIISRQITELTIICIGLFDISLLQRKICQFVKQALTDRRTLKSHEQDILRVLILMVLLIYIGNHRQQIGIADFFPVNGIRNLHGRLKIALIT